MNTEVKNTIDLKSDEVVENKRNAKQVSEIRYYMKMYNAHYENYKGELHLLRFDIKQGPCLVTFRGDSKAMTSNFRYRSPEEREKRVLDYKKSADSWLERKAQRKEQKKNNRINASVGDLFYASWGYDQTNINFYQVIEKKGKATVIIQEVAKANLGNIGSHDEVKAIKDAFIGEPMRKRLGEYGIKIDSVIHASKTDWDSKKSETNAYYRH